VAVTSHDFVIKYDALLNEWLKVSGSLRLSFKYGTQRLIDDCAIPHISFRWRRYKAHLGGWPRGTRHDNR